MPTNASIESSLSAENAKLRARLEEAEETLRAIRAGEVDALVVEGDAGPQLFTLQGLDAEQNRFRGEMLAQVSDAVIAFDLDHRVTYLNAAAERQYRVRASDMLGRNLAEIFTRKWPNPGTEAVLWTALREHGEWRGELIQHTQDGRELHVESSITALRAPDGATTGYVTAIRDIRERKLAEEELFEQRRLYKSVTDNASVSLFIMDERQQCSFMNPAAEELTGFTLDEVRGKALHDLIHHSRPDGSHYLLCECPIDQVFPHNDREQGEEVFVHKDGHFYHVAFTASPIRDRQGKPLGTVIEVEDITERKRSEEAVARLAAIVESSHDALFGENLGGIITSWNPGAERIFGYRADEIVGTSIMRLIPEALRHEELELQRKLAAGERGGTFEAIRQGKDGRKFHASITISPMKDAAGKVIGTSRVVRDITEHKRAEEALARLAAIVESSQDAIVSKDLRGTITSWNHGAETMFGYSAKEIVGQPDLCLIPPERHDEEADILARVGRGEGVRHFETVRLRKDGSTVEVSITVSPVKDASGTIVGISKVERDITARRLVEAALRQNAALFATIIEQAPGGVYVMDAQLRVREVNTEALPIFATVHPVIGREIGEVLETLWGPELGRECTAIVRHTLETGARYVSPRFDHRRHDIGLEQSYEWEAQRITLPDGQHGVVCYSQEVTERERAAAALRESEVLHRASEQRTRLATEATGVGIWEWNVPTNQVRWDATMFALYGVTPTADGFVPYETWSSAVLPEDLPEQEAVLQDTVRRCGHSSRAFRIRRAYDGEIRHIEAVETVRTNAEDQAEWVVGTNLDVTARQHAEEALRAEIAERKKAEEQVRLLIRDLERRVEERVKELATKARLLAERNAEVEQARLTLEVKAAELALTLRYKSEFLANMSHEMRTPLNPILVFSQQLAENKAGNLTEKQVEFSRHINSSGTELLSLITDILDLSKIASGTVTVEVEEIPFAELHAAIDRNFRHITMAKNLPFNVTFSPDLPQAMDSDPRRLQQILKNLLSNAVKFTAHGKVEVRVDVATQGWTPDHPVLSKALQVIAFAVADTGIGIAPEQQGLIFEAFQQGDASTARNYGGTGLGLAISRELASLLGGEIKLRSVPGQGSTFTLFLPLHHTGPNNVRTVPKVPPRLSVMSDIDEITNNVPAEAKKVPPTQRETKARLNGTTPPPVPDEALRGRKVLVVDDDARNIFALTSLLEDHEMEVIAVTNGRSALEMIHRTPDLSLVFMDIMMPEMDGYETMKEIRQDPKFRTLPILALTAKAMPGDREKCLDAGASDYISKPVNSAHLFALMRTFFSHENETY